MLLGVADAGTARFRVDKEGDTIVGGSLTVSGAATMSGTATFGGDPTGSGVSQGAVYVNGERVTDPARELEVGLGDGAALVFKVGRKYAKVVGTPGAEPIS